jgi:uncharacterized protein with PIN domain
MSVGYTNCPYCNKSIELIDVHEFSMDTNQIEECPACKKKFEWYWTQSIDVFANEIEDDQ